MRVESFSPFSHPRMTKLLAGKYEMLELAGVGGMAKVYRGRTHGAAGFVRPVAIKRVIEPLTVNEEFIEMFVEEARVISELQHPNITQIHDFDQDRSGVYFLVMEWVEGINLFDWAAAHRKAGRNTPWSLVTAIGIEVLKALTVAHLRVDADRNPAPIYHRDVTPQNVMLSTQGYVKLTDFGLARAMDRARITRPGIVKGKISYLAPELTHGEEATAQSDIFGIGILFWEVLTGEKLFKGDDPVKVIHAIQRGDIPHIETRRHDLPSELGELVMTALAMDPNERFTSARGMARELAAFLRGTTEVTDADVLTGSVDWAIRQLEGLNQEASAVGPVKAEPLPPHELSHAALPLTRKKG